MMKTEEYSYSFHTLSNGIRLVHRTTTSRVSHCGLTIDMGSRDEKSTENGTAHFIEHCLFKGTEKRKAFQILSCIDGVGGELNAFTTKEETCVYALYLQQYQERFLELLADIAFHSDFPQQPVEKEKVVVLDEINSYLDTPSEQIFDDFEHLIFGNHGLGRMILGTPRRVMSLSCEQLKDFFKRNYTTDKMVVSTISSMPADKWFSLCEKYLGAEPKTTGCMSRKAPRKYEAKSVVEKRDTYQSHIIIGNRAYSSRNPKRVAFSLLNNILGSGAMNSYLNMHIREKYGFTYSIESSYTAYYDSGVFSVYASTDKRHADKTLQLVRQELDRLAQKAINPVSLSKFKHQLIGQLIVNADHNQSEMLAMGKSLLNYGNINSMQEICEHVEQLTPAQVQDVAQEVFAPDELSVIQYL